MMQDHVDSNAVRFLTLNTFLLDVNLRSRATLALRLPLIAPEIARLNPDVIMLQEVWGRRYRRYLQQAFAQLGWGYSAYACPIPAACAGTKLTAGFASFAGLSAVQGARASRRHRRAFIGTAIGSLVLTGASAFAANTLRDYGNGLLIISRWPVRETSAMSFRVHTRWDEALVYKGAIRASIEAPGPAYIDVVNTHLGARTFDFTRGAYEPGTVRANALQLDELMAWIRADARSGAEGAPEATVVAGDFNFDPWVVEDGAITSRRNLSYGKLVDAGPEGLGLIDSFVAANGVTVGGFTGGTAPRGTPPRATATGGDASQTSRRCQKPPERIDYIFVSQAVSVTSSQVVLNEVIRDRADKDHLRQTHGLESLPLHVSDHFGLLSTVELPSGRRLQRRGRDMC
ncbi:MAG: endonuclease/exonuclease/phosphatase family protein [Myxococcota bacterium]